MNMEIFVSEMRNDCGKVLLLSLSYLLTFCYFVAPFLTVSLALLNGPLVRDIFPVSACAFFPIRALKEPEIKSLSQAGTDPGALV